MRGGGGGLKAGYGDIACEGMGGEERGGQGGEMSRVGGEEKVAYPLLAAQGEHVTQEREDDRESADMLRA